MLSLATSGLPVTLLRTIGEFIEIQVCFEGVHFVVDVWTIEVAGFGNDHRVLHVRPSVQELQFVVESLVFSLIVPLSFLALLAKEVVFIPGLELLSLLL